MFENLSESMNVELHHLVTGYRSGKSHEIVISSDIDCCFESGEVVSLLGPNGAGKSTLLKTLSGFIPPLGGEIEIDGKNVRTIGRREFAQTVAVVLTERPQVVSMTVEDMIGMGRAPYTGFGGRLNENDRRIIEDSMRLCGVEVMRTRRVETLSDGELQKVMIAKALAQTTPIVLLDEPSAFLDFPSKVELMLLLRRLAREEGKLVIQSTHDLNIALELSDRLMLVDKEIGTAFGDPGSLAASGDLEKFFHSRSIYLDGLTFRIAKNC